MGTSHFFFKHFFLPSIIQDPKHFFITPEIDIEGDFFLYQNVI